jgi:hypothetical protein
MSNLDKIFAVSNDPVLAESGGSHNQKGVDFQRYWAILRALKLEEEDAADYVFLFESVQDILELDSEHAPTQARIYQVKKKDSGEWAWKELTSLEGPATLKADGTPRKKRQYKDLSKQPTFQNSPLGKLAACAAALSNLNSTGHFISNAGCAVPLATPPGGTASSAQLCHLGQLDPWYVTALEAALTSVVEPGTNALPAAKLHLERTTVHPDEPEDALIGRANELLASRSPAHAAQAKTLVRAMFVAVSAKGRHTGLCKDSEELRQRRGFGKKDVQKSLSELEKVPDLASIRASWMKRLADEGMSIVEHTRIEVALSQLEREKLSGITSVPEAFEKSVADWVSNNPPNVLLTPFITSGADHLRSEFPEIARNRVCAYLLNKGIQLCVDQASES